MLRIFLTNLGCKLNQAEVERLARAFTAAGHVVVGAVEDADVHVVNSCTVTAQAARDSRKLARRGRRANPAVRTVLTGCHASYAPGEVGRMDEVDLIVGNEDKEDLVATVVAAFSAGDDRPTSPVPGPATVRTRAAVKVQDGCAMRCSFCVIPLARGAARSRPAADVVDEVAGLVGEGYREIVLTGVQISSWRHDGGRLADLVEEVLGVAGDARLRLSSLAPWEVDDRLLALFADRRLCRHLHLSLQSGSTPTLARMRRPYTADAYAAAVDRVRAAVAGVAVTTDVIVGFPGETEKDLAESVAFVEAMGFARVHVFPFSPRPGTEAATLPGAVPAPDKKHRVAAMLATAARAEAAFLTRHVGTTAEVLWEERRDGVWSGLTDTYLRVVTATDDDLGNTVTAARLIAVDGSVLTASVAAAV